MFNGVSFFTTSNPAILKEETKLNTEASSLVNLIATLKDDNKITQTLKSLKNLDIKSLNYLAKHFEKGQSKNENIALKIYQILLKKRDPLAYKCQKLTSSIREQENNQIKTQLEKSEARVRYLEEDNEHLRNIVNDQLASLNCELADMVQGQHNAWLIKHESLQSTINTLTETIDYILGLIGAEARERETDSSSLKHELDHLWNRQNDHRHTLIANLSEETTERLKDTQETRESLNNLSLNFRETKEELSQQIIQEAHIRAQEDRKLGIRVTDSNTELKAADQALSNRINGLNANQNDLKNQDAMLSRAIADVKNAILEASRKIESGANDLANLRTIVSKLDHWYENRSTSSSSSYDNNKRDTWDRSSYRREMNRWK